ncbi:recombinase family protein [Alkaliphilus sp. AH-315-G20]|nr:recombinase family protein [Alkaliphilus sp. AH-315-G20]
MIFGYARVSTAEQKLDLQIDALLKYGIDERNIFSEVASGSKNERVKLHELLVYVKSGDTIVVWKLDRIGRSTKHLVDMMTFFEEKKVNFVSLNENFDTSTATGKLVFNIFSSLAQFERDLIIERTNAGLVSARARGRVGGRPKVDKEKISLAMKMYQDGKYTVREIVKASGVSKATLYRNVGGNVSK